MQLKMETNEPNNQNGGDGRWNMYEQYVLHELKVLNRNMVKLADRLDQHMDAEHSKLEEMAIDLAKLKTRIATWGAIVFAAATLLAPVAQDIIVSLTRL